MKKVILLTAMMICISTCLSAQDIIVFRDGSLEQTKIMEVGDDVIKYKKWDNQDGPVFSTGKARILSIKYQDGTEANFGEQLPPQTQTQQTVRQYGNQPTQAQSVGQYYGNQPTQPRQPRQPYVQSSDGGFSIHAGGAFPMGKFGEEPDLEDDMGSGKFSAGTGFSVGIKGKIPVSSNGLGVILGADIIYNGLKGKMQEEYDELENEGDDLKKPKYLNIPVYVGLNYRYDINPTFGLWCEGGVGPNFRKITNIEYSVHAPSESISEKIKFKMQTSVGFQIGGGVMINDTFSVGLHYYGLGKSKQKVTAIGTENGESYTDSYSYKKSAQDVLMIRLGYHF